MVELWLGWGFDKITAISDFYVPGTSQLYTKEQLENKHHIEIDNNDFIELKHIITTSFRKLGLANEPNIATFLPTQPLLISVLNLTKKGCGAYSRLLKKKSNLRRILSKSESKWHAELGCTFSVDFWNQTYNLTSNIKNDNRMRWFQFQINRNSLFTNFRVHKFKNYISPRCSFCSHLVGVPHHNELISHLFFECEFVLFLWQEVRAWLENFNLILDLSRCKLLFGFWSF